MARWTLGAVCTVPFGYLTSTALIAWCRLFALAPPRSGRSSPSNVSYWFGFLLNELPFVAFYGLLVSTLIAVAQARDECSAIRTLRLPTLEAAA